MNENDKCVKKFYLAYFVPGPKFATKKLNVILSTNWCNIHYTLY